MAAILLSIRGFRDDPKDGQGAFLLPILISWTLDFRVLGAFTERMQGKTG
jgi:hypothetical protein